PGGHQALRYLITVAATPAGMPTMAPKARPDPRVPAAQPIRVPITMHAAVDPIRTLPAPARENVGRSGGTGPENSIACDSCFAHLKGGGVTFVTVRLRRAGLRGGGGAPAGSRA